MPIVQVISIIGKPNLWNRAQREFMLWVPTLKFLWRWKLNLRKTVNPTLLEGRFNCKAFGKRICNTVWCLVLFLNERIYSCVPLKVHPSASPSIPLRFIPPLLLIWRFLSSLHYSPFCSAFVYVCLCLCVRFDFDQQGSQSSPADERGRHVTRFIEVIIKCESLNITAESNAGENSIEVWSPGINGEVKGNMTDDTCPPPHLT